MHNWTLLFSQNETKSLWRWSHFLVLHRCCYSLTASKTMAGKSKRHWLDPSDQRRVSDSCVGVRVKQSASVPAQWKHALWDGEPPAGHLSCCGQRFPWQVSPKSSFCFQGCFTRPSCLLKLFASLVLSAQVWTEAQRPDPGWGQTQTTVSANCSPVWHHALKQRNVQRWNDLRPNKGTPPRRPFTASEWTLNPKPRIVQS